jgi:hypothetical protein
MTVKHADLCNVFVEVIKAGDGRDWLVIRIRKRA